MRTMFEMSKLILQRVSFDKKLFKKELLKAAKWLQPKEKTLLYLWCLANFGMYKDIITEVFLHTDRKSTRLNSSHGKLSRMPSSA